MLAVGAATEQDAGARRGCRQDLLVEGVAQVFAGQGADLGRAVEGVADAEARRGGDEALGEGVGDGVYDDEALGGDAALAGVLEARPDADLGGGVEVGVFEDDEGVGAAQLEDGSS